ncbi:MAG: hypothetical protein MUC97_04435 [Bernardetiaceae bacterium]|nr:hypothetical protein [Bernardetiaceae bacterium]
MEKDGVGVLQIANPHLLDLLSLPFHHNDPFDRLLIAQARSEQLTLITDDVKFNLYPVALLP